MKKAHPLASTLSFETVHGWFSLSRYSALKRMPKSAWGQLILRRLVLQEAIDGVRRMPNDHPLLEAEIDFVNESMMRLLSNPLEDAFVVNNQCIPVRSLTVGDIESRARGLSQISQLIATEFQSPEIVFDQLAGESAHPYGHVVINLLARDADIMAEFASWLARRRERFFNAASGSKLRVVAPLEWSSAQMIPYSDLLLWRTWMRKRLTDENIVDLLFPATETDAHEKIRATKNAVKKHMTKENAIALISSAS